MAVGVTSALLHLDILRLDLLGYALTPTISGLMLGSIIGFLIGLLTAVRQRGL